MSQWHRMAAAGMGLLTLVLVAPLVSAETSVSFDIRVGDAYRGASLRFESAPRVVLVPQTKVYYVREYDHDLYRYGRYWYFVEDGTWYRAKSWRGPFRHIHVRSVPRSVMNVPVKYRRNWHGPPAHAQAKGYDKSHKAHPSEKAHRKAHKESRSRSKHRN